MEDEEIPGWQFAQWDGLKLLNPDGPPKWSGKRPPPPVGSVVNKEVRITGYMVDGEWLMALGHHISDPSVTGNIAGAEIWHWGAAT